MSTLKVDTILKRTGTGTITVGQSGDTISIPSGATLSVAGSTSGLPDNTPYFEATLGSNPTLSDDTFTKVTFASERVDSNSAYDTSTGRFTVPSGEAGKYLFNATLCLTGLNADKRWDTFFCQDGSRMSKCYYYSIAVVNNSDIYNNMTCIVDVSEGAAYTCQGYHNHGSDRSFDGSFSYFAGYKLLGV